MGSESGRDGAIEYIGVDIGNSGLRAAKLNLAESQLEEFVRIPWNLGTASENAADDPVTRFHPESDDWFDLLKGLVDGDTHWVISSVRRDACHTLVRKLDSLPGCQIECPSYDQLDLNVALPEPNQVGIDRLFAALAAGKIARNLPDCSNSDQPVVVVQAGSAVTVDLIQFRGPTIEYEGGAILPGIPMMLRLLGAGADLLPQIQADDLTELPTLPGRNTRQAMLCGAASALVGGVQHLVARYRSAHATHQGSQDFQGTDSPNDHSRVPVILSGGDGMRLAPHLPEPILAVSDLVHEGLLAYAIENYT